MACSCCLLRNFLETVTDHTYACIPYGSKFITWKQLPLRGLGDMIFLTRTHTPAKYVIILGRKKEKNIGRNG